MWRCLLAAALAVAAALPAGAAEDFSALLRAARRAEALGDSLNAFFLYGRAAAADPSRRLPALAMQGLGTRLLQSASVVAGRDLAAEASLDPEMRMARRIAVEQLSPSEVIESEAALPPVRLRPSSERRSFDLRGAPRLVIEEVARAFGVQTVFEPDFPAQAVISFRVEAMSREEAFRALETAANVFFVPAREDTVLVFRETTDRRTANVPVMAVALPIPQRTSVQEAQELASGIQQILELRRIAVDAGRRVIFIRDQEYKVLAARRLIAEMLHLRAQVAVEVELLSYSRNSSLGYGLALPNAASIVNFEAPATLARLGRIGAAWFGMGIGNASLLATLARSSAQASLRAQLVTLDGQQAQLLVGDRYPVVTGRASLGTNLNSSFPTTQYQDLGLKLQLTPVVHAGGEMSLTVEAEYNFLTGAFNNGIPVISQRKFQGNVRVGQDQWAVIAGLAVSSAAVSTSGIAGLAQLPGLGRLFRRNTVNEDQGQVLILLKPRLLSEPVWERPAPAFWIGSETKPPTFY
jgi:general secretion pathway protein D